MQIESRLGCNLRMEDPDRGFNDASAVATQQRTEIDRCLYLISILKIHPIEEGRNTGNMTTHKQHVLHNASASKLQEE